MVFTGKAQEVYSSLSHSNSCIHDKVKAAVLKSFELIPEAYQQRFRSCVKKDDQTHLEFTRDLRKHFIHWCSASNVNTLDDLTNLIILEQFKEAIPDCIATFVLKHKVKMPEEAAALADEFALTHKSSFIEGRGRVSSFKQNIHQKGSLHALPKSTFVVPQRLDLNLICNYCREQGHWKADCSALKNKSKCPGSTGHVKPAALAMPVPASNPCCVKSEMVDHVKRGPDMSDVIILTFCYRGACFSPWL